jgi:spoIIIJ-associated protein
MHDLVNTTVAELLEKLGLKFTGITVDDSDEKMIRVDIDSPEASRLIGWHGETVNAIQHLAKSIIRSKEALDRAPFIIIDVDGYKKAQEEKVCRIAEQKVDFVRRKKTRVALPPMSSYFRRVVHLYIANNKDLQDITTESIGDGGYRQIVLKLKEGGIDDGEELVPSISQEEKEVVAEAEGGFENLDV